MNPRARLVALMLLVVAVSSCRGPGPIAQLDKNSGSCQKPLLRPEHVVLEGSVPVCSVHHQRLRNGLCWLNIRQGDGSVANPGGGREDCPNAWIMHLVFGPEPSATMVGTIRVLYCPECRRVYRKRYADIAPPHVEKPF